ncbi:hypothetical protein LSTR_LSTR009784 [Laodelphax striatellus]|uniref:SANT and BTB domain-containing protein n=1 Tax=Laodelphax striatellus TaxID=195883 RepID=A0A482XN54_LAOST|nr:hypothetical protein LSTR_LSTR009784 [Laodelphax striatellus]
MSKKLEPLYKLDRNKRSSRLIEKKFMNIQASKISLKQFLNFLSSAYHINEALENNFCSSTSTHFEWNNVISNEFFEELFNNGRQDTFRVTDENLDSQILFENDSSEDTLESFMNCASDQGTTNPSANNPSNTESSFNIHVEHKAKKKGSDNSGSSNHLRSKSEKVTEVEEFGKSGPENGKHIPNIYSEEKYSKVLDSKINMKGAETVLKNKLDYLLSEAVLDSVLPYLSKPNTNSCQMRKLLYNMESKKPEKTGPIALARENRKKSFSPSRISTSPSNDIEVEIHVCDEAKNLKKDFRCSQRLLISKMGYFAEVTTGQRLQDMDISVHCDVNIFEWLMNWCQKDSASPRGSVPTLDATNVVPILVSASFLQMDPLLEICLHYCRNNINEIIKSPANISCLNDSIVTRLANMFSNVELENLRDKRDKIRSRLYCKMILALAHPEPEPWRGHFVSFAAIYKCLYCKKMILQKIASMISCIPNRMRMDFKGNLVGMHARDGSWNITEYVRSLKADLMCWRKVYWHMWTKGHFLYCLSCQNYYPVYYYDQCWYHPESPQFFSMEQQRSTTFPVGRYPCCGVKAYRFESLQNPKKGCQCKKHNPMLKGNRCNSDIMNIFELYRPIIFDESNATSPVESNLKVKGKRNKEIKKKEEDFKNKECDESRKCWWEGLELAPHSKQQGLLIPEIDKTKDTQLGTWVSLFLSDEKIVSNAGQNTDSNTTPSSASGDDSLEEEEGSDVGEGEDDQQIKLLLRRPTNKPVDPEKHRRRMKLKCSLKRSQWVSKYSTRYNQDNQREYEEKLFHKVDAMLCQRTSSISAAMVDKQSTGCTAAANAAAANAANNSNNNCGCARPPSSPSSTTCRRQISSCASFVPLGGTYVRLEAQWRDTHNTQTIGAYSTINRVKPSGRTKFKHQR